MCYKYNMINGIVSAFGPNTVAKWTKDTPLDGEEMQKSLDMLLENDNLMASGIGERTLIECDEYNHPKEQGGEVIVKKVVGSRWFTYPATELNRERYGEVKVKVEYGADYESLGYTIPIPITNTNNGNWYDNGHLTCERSENPVTHDPYMRLFWATSETRWTRVIDVQAKKMDVAQSRTFEISKFRIPCETGDLDCGENTRGNVQLYGTIELEITDSNGDNVPNEVFLNAEVMLGTNSFSKPFIPLYVIGSNGKAIAAKTQILNIAANIPARAFTGSEHSLTLNFNIATGGPYVSCKSSTLMVTYCKGTV